MSLCRSSRLEVLLKKGVLRNFAKFTGKHLSLLKKRLWRRCFSVSSATFLRTPFIIEQLRWLLLCLTDFADGYSQETNTCSKSVTEIVEKTVEYAQK